MIEFVSLERAPDDFFAAQPIEEAREGGTRRGLFGQHFFLRLAIYEADPSHDDASRLNQGNPLSENEQEGH